MLISSLRIDFRPMRNGYGGNALWLCQGTGGGSRSRWPEPTWLGARKASAFTGRADQGRGRPRCRFLTASDILRLQRVRLERPLIVTAVSYPSALETGAQHAGDWMF